MKIYLAGPMRGIPLFNFPAFHEAAGKLRALGHEVYDPAEADIARGFDPAKDDEKSESQYMEWDLPEVCKADAVAVLPGWENSRLAKLEIYNACYLRKPILNASDLTTVVDENMNFILITVRGLGSLLSGGGLSKVIL